MRKVDIWKNNWNLIRRTDTRMNNAKMVKRHENDDRLIDEHLQSDNQGHHNLVMGKRVNA